MIESNTENKKLMKKNNPNNLHLNRSSRPSRLNIQNKKLKEIGSHILQWSWLILCLIYFELFFALQMSARPGIYAIVMSISLGFFLFACIALVPIRKIRLAIQGVLTILFFILFISQYLYYEIFGTVFIIQSLRGATDAMSFSDVLADALLHNLLGIVLFSLPLPLFFVVVRKVAPVTRYQTKTKMICLALAVAICLIATGSVVMNNRGSMSPRRLFLSEFAHEVSLQRLGLVQTTGLDIRYNVFGIRFSISDQVQLDNVVIEDDFSTESDVTESDIIETVPTETDPEPTEPTVEPTEPEVIVYEPNIMDIDFPEEESNNTISAMNDYFSNREPSMQNEYTGMFEGKNLIFITAEAMSVFMIDPELMPTLYMMYTEGFVFENFYTPIWGVSTSDGEFVATTGLIPKSGVWSYSAIASNHMPFAFGHQFAALGYLTLAYHNHTYTYYNRHLSHPAMGYEYYGVGNGLDVARTWPASDLEMMELTGPEFVDNAPFHVYYMTVSGHLRYNFSGNYIAQKNRDLVDHLEYSNSVRAYYACQMELDFALAELIDQLDAAGELENTVFAISSDHYPYGLESHEHNELAGKTLERPFSLFENAFILWSASMEEPVIVETYCSSLDIAPTLANLFGIEYDSRLYMGTDILSDSEKYVVFNDRSFINERIKYNAGTRTVTRLVDEDITDEYLAECIQHVNDMFTYSTRIIDQDYYGYLFLEDE